MNSWRQRNSVAAAWLTVRTIPAPSVTICVSSVKSNAGGCRNSETLSLCAFAASSVVIAPSVMDGGQVIVGLQQFEDLLGVLFGLFGLFEESADGLGVAEFGFSFGELPAEDRFFAEGADRDPQGRFECLRLVGEQTAPFKSMADVAAEPQELFVADLPQSPAALRAGKDGNVAVALVVDLFAHGLLDRAIEVGQRVFSGRAVDGFVNE